MADGSGPAYGRELLIARGLVDWLSLFGKAPPDGCMGQNHALTKRGFPEATDEIVVLFANILQEATYNGIQPENIGCPTQT
jgi:hypothetical protein